MLYGGQPPVAIHHGREAPELLWDVWHCARDIRTERRHLRGPLTALAHILHATLAVPVALTALPHSLYYAALTLLAHLLY